MRGKRFILAVALMAASGLGLAQSGSPSAQNPATNAPPAAGASESRGIPILPCGADDASCNPSKKEAKEARADFARGLKLQKAKHLEEAFDAFKSAAQLSPRNVEYVTAREMVRQQLAFDNLQRGNAALLAGQPLQALAEFEDAAQLDPQNEFARQRVRDTLGETAAKASARAQLVKASGELRVQPNEVHADFHYNGDGRELLSEIAKVFGLDVVFDDSFTAKPVHFQITGVDFYTAMRAASAVTHTFWTPLQTHQILVAAESRDNHNKFDRMAMRTFFLPGLATPADFTNVANLLRSLFEIRVVTAQPTEGTITINAPEPLLDAATQFLESMGDSRPEVMLDVRVYQVSYTFMRSLGLQIPNNFQLFNIPAAALLALGGQNIQSLINQLIANGGINQANVQSLQALLAQAQGQSQQSSIFSQPVATFGNGQTLMGLSLGTVAFQAALNQSWVTDLEHSTLRVSQGSDATFRVGSRYPILNASFAPIFNSPAIAQVIGNNSFQAPFPSFSYEDLGLTIKAKPLVSRDSVVSLGLQLQLRTLLGQSLNGVPLIANQEFDSSITLLDGEPAVVAGAITRSETRTLSGIPGLGDVPGLNQVMTNNNKQEEDDELLIVVTPRVIANSNAAQATVWLP